MSGKKPSVDRGFKATERQHSLTRPNMGACVDSSSPGSLPTRQRAFGLTSAREDLIHTTYRT